MLRLIVMKWDIAALKRCLPGLNQVVDSIVSMWILSEDEKPDSWKGTATLLWHRHLKSLPRHNFGSFHVIQSSIFFYGDLSMTLCLVLLFPGAYYSPYLLSLLGSDGIKSSCCPKSKALWLSLKANDFCANFLNLNLQDWIEFQ